MADLDIPLPAGGATAAAAAGGPSYRVARPGRGTLDSGTKRLLLAAGGIGTLLLALTIGWAVSHRRPGTIPVIEADSRPIRVKPENAGGMQVIGADEQVMGDGGRPTTAALAPPPEIPSPTALRAQSAPALPLEVPPQAAAQPGPAGAGGGAPGSPVTAAGRAQVQAGPALPAAVAARSGAPASGGSAGTGGAVQVQLAALDSEQTANAEWQRLARQMPDLLGQRRPSVQRTERDGKTLWRLRTGGFADIADATAFCGRVKAKGASCSIANF